MGSRLIGIDTNNRDRFLTVTTVATTQVIDKHVTTVAATQVTETLLDKRGCARYRVVQKLT